MTTARTESVAKFICAKSGWTITNLHLQKILYLSQMVYMGENGGEKLFEGTFEAWAYGPVEPCTYRQLKMFGSGPVQDVFYDAGEFKENDPRRAFLDKICADLIGRSAGNLVEITHWKNGAWAKHYDSGIRGIRIPDEDIAREYSDRVAAYSSTPNSGNSAAA